MSSLSLELINPATLVLRHLLWGVSTCSACSSPAGVTDTCHALVFYVAIKDLVMSEHLILGVVSLGPYRLEISFLGGFSCVSGVSSYSVGWSLETYFVFI